MPSKLGPHFIGAPGFERWLAAGTRVMKFDPTSLGVSIHVPADSGILVVGKLDQEEPQLKLTDWKALMNRGASPGEAARDRFDAQRNISAGPKKPRIDRYAANSRIDVWEDDNEVVPDTPQEAQWYSAYCIEMMQRYDTIGKKRANFSFATGTPDIRPGHPGDVWPHLLPAIRHAHDHGHYLALHEYMGPEADLGVGRRQVDVHRRRIPDAWHGRRDAQGNPDERYPYGYCPLRYRYIYDLYLRPAGLAGTPLLITECGCDGVDTITPDDMEAGSWISLRNGFWSRAGHDPEPHYAGMLQWYDQRLREDAFVVGGMIFTVGAARGTKWVDWDIAGTGVEERLLTYIAAERNTPDRPVPAPAAAVSATPAPVSPAPAPPPSTQPAAEPAATQPVVTHAAAEAIGIVTATAGLNLRSEPTTAGAGETIIRLLPLGQTVAILGRTDGWYRVRVDRDEGFAFADFVAVDPPPSPKEEGLEGLESFLESLPPANFGVVTAPAGLNLRAAPNVTAPILTMLPPDTRLELLDLSDGWYRVRVAGQEGFVAADFVAPDATSTTAELPATAVEIGFVTAPAGLNLRAAPDTTAAILTRLDKDKRVHLLGLANGWYHVRADGQTGFVSAEFITTVAPAATGLAAPPIVAGRPRSAPVIGIHGAPGGAAPPRHLWDTWTTLLKEMGIHWYKQCETSPEDTGPNSIFQWVLHLKRNGFEPIVRYLMSEQFPGNLEGKYFQQMRRYAENGVTWAELGNEPNLRYEWRTDWQGRYEGKWPDGRWAEEPRMRWSNPEAIATLARVWVEDASRAADMGAWPAFYAFGPTDWGQHRPDSKYSSTMFTDLVVARLASHHRAETLRLFHERRAWIAVHVAKYEKELSFDPYQESPNRPWDMSLRGYEVVLNAFRKHFGHDLNLKAVPIISTEGGVFVPDHKNSIDAWRLPPNDEEHARQTVEMFRYIERETPLTAMCPWCIAEGHAIIGHGTDLFRHHGWFREDGGKLRERPILHAMRRLKEEGGKGIALEELAGQGLETLSAPAAAERETTITLTITVKVKGVAAEDVTVEVRPITNT